MSTPKTRGKMAACGVLVCVCVCVCVCVVCVHVCVCVCVGGCAFDVLGVHQFSYQLCYFGADFIIFHHVGKYFATPIWSSITI